MTKRSLFVFSAVILGVIILLLIPIVQTIVFGHARDAISRIIPQDEIASGIISHRGDIRDDDPGQDALHRASGTVTIEIIDGDTFVRLGEDFTSTPGPDYHVYISDTLNVVDEQSFLATEHMELGRLVRGKGASVYVLPREPYNDISITIWCKAFVEFIGSANVKRLI